MKGEIDLKTVEAVESKEKGASMVEYALLVALIAIMAIAAIRILGSRVSQKFSTVSSAVG